jgi:hypothetical protein
MRPLFVRDKDWDFGVYWDCAARHYAVDAESSILGVQDSGWRGNDSAQWQS